MFANGFRSYTDAGSYCLLELLLYGSASLSLITLLHNVAQNLIGGSIYLDYPFVHVLICHDTCVSNYHGPLIECLIRELRCWSIEELISWAMGLLGCLITEPLSFRGLIKLWTSFCLIEQNFRKIWFPAEKPIRLGILWYPKLWKSPFQSAHRLPGMEREPQGSTWRRRRSRGWKAMPCCWPGSHGSCQSWWTWLTRYGGIPGGIPVELWFNSTLTPLTSMGLAWLYLPWQNYANAPGISGACGQERVDATWGVRGWGSQILLKSHGTCRSHDLPR